MCKFEIVVFVSGIFALIILWGFSMFNKIDLGPHQGKSLKKKPKIII